MTLFVDSIDKDKKRAGISYMVEASGTPASTDMSFYISEYVDRTGEDISEEKTPVLCFNLYEAVKECLEWCSTGHGSFSATKDARNRWLRNADHLERAALLIRHVAGNDALFIEEIEQP